MKIKKKKETDTKTQSSAHNPLIKKKNGWINPGPDRFKKEEEEGLPSIIM